MDANLFYLYAFLFALVPILVVFGALYPYSHYRRGSVPAALIIVVLVSLACAGAFGYLGARDYANNDETAAWISVSLGNAGAALPIASLFILIVIWVLIRFRGADRGVSIMFGRPAA